MTEIPQNIESKENIAKQTAEGDSNTLPELGDKMDKPATALSESLNWAKKSAHKADLKEEAVDNLENSDEYQNKIKEVSNDIQSEIDWLKSKNWGEISKEEISAIIKSNMEKWSWDFKELWIDFDPIYDILTDLSLDWELTVDDINSVTPDIIDTVYNTESVKEYVDASYELKEAINDAKEKAKIDLEKYINDITNKIIERWDSFINSDNFEKSYNDFISDLDWRINSLPIIDTDSILAEFEPSWDAKIDKVSKKFLEENKEKMLEIANTIKNSFGWQWLKDIMEDYYKDWEITDDEKGEIKERVGSLFKDAMSQIDFLWIYK